MKQVILFCAAASALWAQTGQPTAPLIHRASVAQRAEPEYAEEARRAGLQGNVVVFVEVDSVGTVENASVIQGLGRGLDEKALEAVRHITFNAARRAEASYAVLQDPPAMGIVRRDAW